MAQLILLGLLLSSYCVLSAFSQEYVPITSSLYDKLDDPRSTFPFYIGKVDNGVSVYTSKKWTARPTEYHWRYDDTAWVQLPLSSSFRIGGSFGWDVVERELNKLRSSGRTGSDVAAAIRAYNPSIASSSNFGILNDPEVAPGLKAFLPTIIEHALQLPNRVSRPIPVLQKETDHTIYLTRSLAASLLANAFLGTFQHDSKRSSDLPIYHFTRVFDDSGRRDHKVEKLKHLIEYFKLLGNGGSNLDNSIISYERRYVGGTSKVAWASSSKPLIRVETSVNDGIENAEGHLQVDFANRFVGGGVVGNGLTQEEIRFLLSPELIVSLLFTEVLGDDEVLVVTGTRQFSDCSGYGATYKFRPLGTSLPYSVLKDNLGRETTQVVAMDALKFERPNDWAQYEKPKLDRELHKAYVGFIHGRFVTPVATGNWGAGVFNGDPELKFLIQWMAASEVERPAIRYYTFHSASQASDINDISSFLSSRRVTVGQLYNVLLKYRGDGPLSVFEFVKSRF